MGAEDVSLVFDPGTFERGFASIEKFMNALGQKLGGFGKGMAFAVARGEIAVRALGKALHFITAMINEQMPEIGATFGVVKDIVARNFFFPLRQTVLPLLQRLLDWTRSHRAMFVQWGQVAVGLFKTIYSVASTVAGALKNLLTAVFPRFKTMFGTDFADKVNLLLLKISAASIAVGIAFERIAAFAAPFFAEFMPALEKLVGLLANTVWSAVTGFFSGLAEFGPRIKENLTGIGEAFGRLVDSLSRLFGGTDFGAKLKGLFKTLGEFEGANITNALKAVQVAIDLVVTSINALVGVIDTINGKKVDWGKIFGPLAADLGLDKVLPEARSQIQTKGFLPAMGSAIGAGAEKTLPMILGTLQGIPGIGALFGAAQSLIPAQDVIVTKTGKVIQTSPSDDIFAGASPPSSSTVNHNSFTVVIPPLPPGVSPQEVARIVDRRLRQSFKDNVLSCRVRDGL